MTPLRTLLTLSLLVLLPLGLGGCLFDHPLTSFSATNLDTRLLGVFEFRQPDPNAPKVLNPTPTPTPVPGQPPPDDHAIVHRVAVLPLGANRYAIFYKNFSKKGSKVQRFTGWISRVDSNYYLSFRNDTEGSPDFGKFGFFKFTWVYPGDIQLFAPDLKGLEGASSFQLRTAVRKGLKAGTLFPYEATLWKKIARVWWDPAGAKDGSSIPPEFENGTKLLSPGL